MPGVDIGNDIVEIEVWGRYMYIYVYIYIYMYVCMYVYIFFGVRFEVKLLGVESLGWRLLAEDVELRVELGTSIGYLYITDSIIIIFKEYINM